MCHLREKILFCQKEYIFEGLIFFFAKPFDPVTFQNSSIDPEKWYSCFYLEKVDSHEPQKTIFNFYGSLNKYN